MVGSSVVGPKRQPVQGVPCPFSLSRRAGEEGKQCDARHESRSCPPAPVSPDSTSDNIVGRVDGLHAHLEDIAEEGDVIAEGSCRYDNLGGGWHRNGR